MADQVAKDTADKPKPVQAPDFGSVFHDTSPWANTRSVRNPYMQQEQGPPPTVTPHSNRDKFPDTQGPKPWFPTDSPFNRPPWEIGREDRPGGWGVHYFDKAPTPMPLPNPGEKPKPPSTPTDGYSKQPDQIQPLRLTDEEAKTSVLQNVDARSIYLTGAVTGAGMQTGVHLADRWTGAIEPSQRTGAAAYWRDNFSPSQRLVPERRAAVETLESALPELRTAENAAAHTLMRQNRYREQLVSTLQGQIPQSPITASERAWYNARVEMVNQRTLFTPANIAANTGTDLEVQMRQRLFTRAEAVPMMNQASDFWTATSNHVNAEAAVTQNELQHGRAVQLLTRAERGSITTAGESLIRGAGQGLLVATATVASDALIDKALGNDPALSNSAHWGLQGIGMPALLLSRAGMPGKIAGSVALVAGSHLLDKYMGPPTGAFGIFARPSLPEIGLATAGALAPVRDVRVRAGLALGGWALGKAWNLVDDKFELTGRTEPRLRDETMAAVVTDLSAPSRERFNFATDQMHAFSNRNDAASAALIRDWQKDTSAKTAIEKERGNAELMLGYGESVLERGSRVDQNKWDKEGKRMLAGTGYDFGGEASTYLRAASGNLEDAIKLAKENKGKSISSGVINDDYISQLEYAKVRADKNLELVYSSHNISEVYSEVKANVVAHEAEMRTFGENLNQYSKTLSDKDPRYKAKILRDLAILNVAFGDADPTTGGRAEHYRNASRHVAQATNLDPGAPDLTAVSALLNPYRK